jgi:hypothetical protein
MLLYPKPKPHSIGDPKSLIIMLLSLKGLLPGLSRKQIARFSPAAVLTSEQRITHPKETPCPLLS